jgi:hypothetical protein
MANTQNEDTGHTVARKLNFGVKLIGKLERNK